MGVVSFVLGAAITVALSIVIAQLPHLNNINGQLPTIGRGPLLTSPGSPLEGDGGGGHGGDTDCCSKTDLEEAQNVYLHFWFEVEAFFATLGPHGVPPTTINTRFTQLVVETCTVDVRLVFPIAGVNVTGRDALVGALTAQVSSLGNIGEHHVTSIPLVKRLSGGRIELTMNDVAFAHSTSSENATATIDKIWLGRKRVIVEPRGVRTSPPSVWKYRIAELYLDTRAAFDFPSGYGTWLELTVPRPDWPLP